MLGGPGPILMYQLGAHRIRVIVDVPLDQWIPRDRVGLLSDSYAGFLPEALRAGFVDALRAGNFHVAANELRPRVTYGNSHRTLIGDAAGHYHPMTAVGMTLGFGDALTLAESEDFEEFTAKRFQVTRAPQLLAMGLYEVFADHRTESVALRHAVYRSWRSHARTHDHTIDQLACEDTSVPRLSFAFSTTVLSAVVREIPRSLDQLAWRRVGDLIRALATRLSWLLKGVRQLWESRRSGGMQADRARESLAGAFLTSIPSKADDLKPVRPREAESPEAGQALERACTRLLELQQEDGGWEGEMVWCPMLAAQYVLAHYIMGRELPLARRRSLLRHFEDTRLEGGAWGMHEHSHAHLFVTTLVYVAMRVLGVGPEDPRVEPARHFLQAEGVPGIPSWGKFWLALLNLYDWRGVNTVLPELYRLPRWIVLHPSNWYCHTRLIYMAMAAIYPHRFQAPVTPLIEALRHELYPQGYAGVNFSRARNHLRDEDLFARPSVWLRAGFALARVYERFHARGLRARCRQALIPRIRWELQTTSHTSISPVSGLLNILALWLHNADAATASRRSEKLEGWVWENGHACTGDRLREVPRGIPASPCRPGHGTATQRRGETPLRRGATSCPAASRVSFEGYREGTVPTPGAAGVSPRMAWLAGIRLHAKRCSESLPPGARLRLRRPLPMRSVSCCKARTARVDSAATRQSAPGSVSSG